MSNFEENKNLWDRYAKNWDHISPGAIEDKNMRKEDLEYIGDEWGNKKDVDDIIRDYIFPFVNKDSVVGEIGIGGGRIASRVAGEVKELFGLDISKEMIGNAMKALSDYDNINFLLLNDNYLPDEFENTFDFIYSFDVFVHFDLHTMWQWFQEIKRILKPGGKAFLHVANLKSPGGWQRFVSQKNYRVEGHYFISPEIVDILAKQAGMKVIKKSSFNSVNFYLNRDYLFILEA